MAKKRIPIDKERFETLKNELVRVSNIDLSSDNAYSDLCDYIKKQSNTNFPLPKYEDGSIIQQSETISVDTLRRYWGDKDAYTGAFRPGGRRRNGSGAGGNPQYRGTILRRRFDTAGRKLYQ